MFRWQSRTLKNVVISATIFLLIFGIYISNREVKPILDPVWTLYIATSIVEEGNTNLDEYHAILETLRSYAIVDVNGHLYSFFPIGTPILVVPFAYIIDQFTRLYWSVSFQDLLLSSPVGVTLDLEIFIASFFAASVCVVLYWFSRLHLDGVRALILTLILAFGSSLWSTASRALWQHGPSMLMLSLSLYLLFFAKSKPWIIQFAGFFLACAYVIRPTNSIPIFFITLLVFLDYRAYFLRYLFWASIIAIPFLLFNFSIYHSIFQPYYAPDRAGSNPAFFEALAGNLVSPSRGLWIYSPVFIFSIYGVILEIRCARFDKLNILVAAVPLFHWIAISSFPNYWWGGYCYGPRLFADVVPFLGYWLVPVLRRMNLAAGRHYLLMGLFSLSVVMSLFMHARGATEPDAAIAWNHGNYPIVNDVDSDRAWDWSDPQFWRGLRSPKLSARPSALYLSRVDGTEAIAVTDLLVSNIGDGELLWDIKVPRRLTLLMEPSQFSPIQSVTSHGVMIRINTSGYDVGLHSLGGIYLSGSSFQRRAVKSSPIVIPVTLHIKPRMDPIHNIGQDGKYKAFLSVPILNYPSTELLALPEDINVDGAMLEATSEQLWGVYGEGWYDLEQIENFHWRWAESPSELYIYSPERQDVRLESVPVSLYVPPLDQEDETSSLLRVLTNDRDAREVALRVDQPFEVDVNLLEGWNVLRFDLAAGNFRPSDINPGDGDMRVLSFALKGFNIIPIEGNR